ncbi:hypothetical protein [Sinorhizobium meliloti]|uniref:hypothetical protein n=1 Tax=Rhizobium meliloti TaxID=382 RepID=UPI000FDC26F1|nr:hypothetical protein [Sinorhizobium meliloti]MDW9908843.1 hypothetical protein [Sinorhizobium meliloti]RVI61824.1 hypothetical protein CN189_20275 [Sinorhizobium meliloti]
MAKSNVRAGKTEMLTIRLDPKTRFLLDYVARLNGQTITTVVERAIRTAATNNSIPQQGQYDPDITWEDLWDVSEGVRKLKMAAIPELYPTYEEEQRLTFAREHWPFFYSSQKAEKFITPYVDVLWPRIDEFVQMHEEGRVRDYFAAGAAMQQALKEANLRAPNWPIEEKPEPKREPGNFSRDLDDDIPF